MIFAVLLSAVDIPVGSFPKQRLVIKSGACVHDEVFIVFVSYQSYEYARRLVSRKCLANVKTSSFLIIITMATERKFS